MTDPSQLEHVTVTTGASRLSPRSEVADTVVADIRAALAADGVLGDSGWAVRLLAGTPDGAHVYDLLYRGHRIVACWLCVARPASEPLWDYASRAVSGCRPTPSRPTPRGDGPSRDTSRWPVPQCRPGWSRGGREKPRRAEARRGWGVGPSPIARSDRLAGWGLYNSRRSTRRPTRR